MLRIIMLFYLLCSIMCERSHTVERGVDFSSACFSMSCPRIPSRGRRPLIRQRGAGGGVFTGLRPLGPEQSRAVCSCWGGICGSGPEHMSLSPFYRSSREPLLHMFTLKLFVSETLFSPQLAPQPAFPPNKHSTGNCRDIWDFWGLLVERRRSLEQGCSLWDPGGEGRAKMQAGGGTRRGGRDPALGGWWAPSVIHTSTDKQVQVTQFPMTPRGASVREGRPRHWRGQTGLKVKANHTLTQRVG